MKAKCINSYIFTLYINQYLAKIDVRCCLSSPRYIFHFFFNLDREPSLIFNCLLTLILLEVKMISLCHQYKARPVWPGSNSHLGSLKNKKCVHKTWMPPLSSFVLKLKNFQAEGWTDKGKSKYPLLRVMAQW